MKKQHLSQPKEWQLDDFKGFALPPEQQKALKGGNDGDGGGGHEDVMDT